MILKMLYFWNETLRIISQITITWKSVNKKLSITQKCALPHFFFKKEAFKQSFYDWKVLYNMPKYFGVFMPWGIEKAFSGSRKLDKLELCILFFPSYPFSNFWSFFVKYSKMLTHTNRYFLKVNQNHISRKKVFLVFS